MGYSEELLDLIRSKGKTIGTETYKDALFIKGSIPVGRMAKAIEEYANGVSPDEIYFLMDTTALGSGKNGLLFTDTAMYFKGSLEKPQNITYASIDRCEVVTAESGKDEDAALLIHIKGWEAIKIERSYLYKTALAELLESIVSLYNSSVYKDDINSQSDSTEQKNEETFFCYNCGAQITKGVAFCSKCGTKVQSESVAPAAEEIETGKATVEILPATPKSDEGISCPECGSHDLFPFSETDVEVSGGGYGFGSGCCGWLLLGPFGLLCGLCGRDTKSKSTVRQFWICKSCGHKFRDAKDEIKETKKDAANGIGFFFLVLIAGLFFDNNEIEFIFPAWLYITAGILGMLFSAALFIISALNMDIDTAFEKIKNGFKKQ